MGFCSMFETSREGGAVVPGCCGVKPGTVSWYKSSKEGDGELTVVGARTSSSGAEILDDARMGECIVNESRRIESGNAMAASS